MTAIVSLPVDATGNTATIGAVIDDLGIDASDLLIAYVVGSKVTFVKYPL